MLEALLGDVVSGLLLLALIVAAARSAQRDRRPCRRMIPDLDVVGTIVIAGEGVRLVDDHSGYVLEGPYDWRLDEA